MTDPAVPSNPAHPRLTPPLPTLTGAFLGILQLTWSSLLSWRRLPSILALTLAFPLLATLTLATASGHQSEGFRMWILHLYAPFMVPITCLLSGGSMIRDELQAGTLPFLVTRPLSRARLLLLKYLAHVAWLELMLALNAVLLTAAGLSLRLDGALPLGLWLLGVQTALIPAFTAVSVLLGLASKRYVLLGVLYGAIVEIGFGQIPTNLNVLSLSRHFEALLGTCPALTATVALPAWGWPGALLEVATLTTVALTASALLFSYREFQETEPPR